MTTVSTIARAALTAFGALVLSTACVGAATAPAMAATLQVR